jgi:Cd2+/Zn2+-exporting ATPase
MGMKTPSHQSSPPPPPVESPTCTGACGCAPISLAPPVPTAARTTGGATVLHIPTLDCPSEEQDIRRALAAVPGIHALRFELAARTLTIEAPPDTLAAAVSAIRRAGFAPRPLEPRGEAETGQDRAIMDWGIWRAGTALLLSTYTKGLAALRRGQLNMNALMGVAVTGAFLIGQWPEAAMVMALYAIAELIEARSVDRARNAIKSLLDLTPDTAEVRQADGGWRKSRRTGGAGRLRARQAWVREFRSMAASRPGTSAVNQAPVTGESIPVDKAVGDPVFAGTINETGMLEFGSRPICQQYDAGPHHPCGRAGPGRARHRRSASSIDLPQIYTPDRVRHCRRGGPLTPLAARLDLDRGALQGAGAAGHRLPLRPGDRHPGDGGQRIGGGGAARHPDQGRRLSGRRRKLRAIALDKTGTITEGKPRLVATECVCPRRPKHRCWPGRPAWPGTPTIRSQRRSRRGLGLPENGGCRISSPFPGRGIEAAPTASG